MATRRSSKLVQDNLFQDDVETSSASGSGQGGKIEALGLTFESEAARREYFTSILEQRLADPEFRAQPGFPAGKDEDILRMSDPPWSTACPNPFLDEFMQAYGQPHEPLDGYHRKPFNSDTSEGKTDPLYRAHSYHTKVPHLAIVPFILHYTEPGDIVLDGFCGSGMTGVAAQWCGSAPKAYRDSLEARWQEEKRGKPKWGARRAVLNDLSPAATFIASNYNLPFDIKTFEKAAQKLLREVDFELGWMYETRHSDGSKGRINYTVWSEVFACGACGGEVEFVTEALDLETKRVKESFSCPKCGVELEKGKGQVDQDSTSGSRGTRRVERLVRLFETLVDPVTGRPWKRIRLKPVLINYSVGTDRFEKALDEHDAALLERIQQLGLPGEVPTIAFPIDDMYHGSRLAPKGFTHVHHFFLPRAAQAMAALWRKAHAYPEPRLRNMLLWFVEQAIWGMSVLNRYKTIMHNKTQSSNVNQYLSGVYYVPSQHSEVSPWYNLENRLFRLKTHAFTRAFSRESQVIVAVESTTDLRLPAHSIDYIFTDPPFGENIYYADLNYLVESWHAVWSDTKPEAIIDRAKKKTLADYQSLMHQCFLEYFRVLKPNRWMTMVFHNSSNLVWNAIQEAMGEAGFVVAEVRTLDKQQGSYRQVTSSAMKTDLLVSSFKPSEKLHQEANTDQGVWRFVREFIEHLTPVMYSDGHLEVQVDRTRQGLFDRLVAFYLQRRLPIPLAATTFFSGLEERFVERDAMFFVPTQVAEYEKARAQSTDDLEIPLFIKDEKSAIGWVRAELERRPQMQQELTPKFYQAQQVWDRHEQGIELRHVLEASFDCYDGTGPVPSALHTYLSRNYHDLRQLPKDHPRLVEKARERWYVPDPGKAKEMEQRRRRVLLRDFEGYRESKGKRFKEFRKEVIRVGFAVAYEANDFRAIVEVADRLPESVLEEDFELYMFVNNARTLVGE